jgi:hypothetical protein
MAINPFAGPKRTLLIDIGGTSIKSYYTDLSDSGQFLKSLKAGAIGIRRSPWEKHGLVETLRDLVKEPEPEEVWKHTGGHGPTIKVIERRPQTFKRIRVSITDHTSGDSRSYRGYLTRTGGLPEDLAEQMERWAGGGWSRSCGILIPNEPITLTHDTRAWGLGFQRILKDEYRVFSEPVGLLVVGTGISFVKVSPQLLVFSKMECPELSDAPHDWTRLRDQGGWGETSRAPHNHLAKPFFDWLDSQEWSAARKDDEINVRSNMLLEELVSVHRIRKFVFAGGFAERFSKINTQYPVEILTKRQLGFDPDFIPMLGLL